MAGTLHATAVPETRATANRATAKRDAVRRARIDRLVPAGLRSHGDEFDRTLHERTRRMWVFDVISAFFVIASAVGIWLTGTQDGNTRPELMTVFDITLVPLAIGLLFWRRKYPFRIAVTLAVISCLAPSAGTAGLIGLFAVAAYSRPAVGVLGIGIGLIQAPVAALIWPHASGNASFLSNVIFGIVITLGVGAWGLFAGARRELMASLRERATRAESEQQLRVNQARQAERTRIAREMHDVLAHRMSLLSIHAGALEYRPDAPAEEVARAAGVIRATAHEALEELRTVIGVLRVGDSLATGPAGFAAPSAAASAAAVRGGAVAHAGTGVRGGVVAQDGTAPFAPEPPQPTLAALPHLVDEWRQAGARIQLDTAAIDQVMVPPAVGRTAYRIVQEALTNAGKHAPTAKVSVQLDGAPGDSLRISVTNSLPRGAGAGAGQRPAVPIPGTGLGLVGLRERTELVGGAFAAGIDEDLRRFVLEARLPWAAA